MYSLVDFDSVAGFGLSKSNLHGRMPFIITATGTVCHKIHAHVLVVL